MVKSLTEASVKEGIMNGVVALDCYAPWCAPCKTLDPIIEDLANTTAKASVYKLNVEDTPDFSGKYEIMSVPTVLFFKEGQLVKRSLGVKPKEEYVKIIEELS